MQAKSLLSCLLALVLLSGCSVLNQQRESTSQALPQAQIIHIVVIWLREPGNEAHRQTLITASQQLTQIPGVIAVEGGSVITSERSVVDSSFDVALVFKLQNQQALRGYVQHPLHKKLLKEVFKPLIERYRVYDVEPHLFEE